MLLFNSAAKFINMTRVFIFIVYISYAPSVSNGHKHVELHPKIPKNAKAAHLSLLLLLAGVETALAREAHGRKRKIE